MMLIMILLICVIIELKVMVGCRVEGKLISVIV